MLLHDVSSSFINIIPYVCRLYVRGPHILYIIMFLRMCLTLDRLVFMDIITKMRRNDSNNLQKMVFLACCRFFCITVFVVITIILRSLKLIQCNNNKVLIDVDDALAQRSADVLIAHSMRSKRITIIQLMHIINNSNNNNNNHMHKSGLDLWIEQNFVGQYSCCMIQHIYMITDH